MRLRLNLGDEKRQKSTDFLNKKYALVQQKVRTCWRKSTDFFINKYGLVEQHAWTPHPSSARKIISRGNPCGHLFQQM